MQKPKEDKLLKPVDPPNIKTVKIKINQDRTIAGLGKAGEEFEVSELVAENFVAQGLATIIEKKEK